MVLKLRQDIAEQDTWDLSDLFASDAQFEAELKRLDVAVESLADYEKQLPMDATHLLEFTKTYFEFSEQLERLGSYAFLKNTEDVTVGKYQIYVDKTINLDSKFSSITSFFSPSIIAFDEAFYQKIIADEKFADFAIFFQKVWRKKKHTLSDKEEKILTQLIKTGYGSKKIFSVLTNADFIFGDIECEKGLVPVTQSSIGSLLTSKNRETRKKAFMIFMGKFDEYKNTLASVFSNKLEHSTTVSKLRNYPSSLEASLFQDEVPKRIYDNLIEQVRAAVPAVSKYINLRKKVLKLKEVYSYDLRVGLCDTEPRETTYDDAVDLCLDSLEILGPEYVSVLSKGLKNRWVDRYENKGKRSGAFSAGSYHGNPYILLNYREDHFDSIFTLIHEAGHSMHSYYSVKNNPFPNYHYTIFVAEVASTFNEELLFQHLMKNETSDLMKASLINKKIDDIYGTVFRQTMFAEFEKIVHAEIEAGKPLTIEDYRVIFAQLQKDYFSDALSVHELNSLEGLRIPHFYSPFYVYKYATGLSASIYLANKVRNGGPEDLARYLSFLKGGGSKPPLEQLKDAGVDMTKPEAVKAVLSQFSSLVDQLETYLDK